MESITNQETSRIQGTSGFATLTRGCAFGTDLVTSAIVRDRKAVAVKGHMALVAYVPGIHAWSPPIC